MNYSIQKSLKLVNKLISKNSFKILIFYNFGKLYNNNLSNYITYYDITDQSILYNETHNTKNENVDADTYSFEFNALPKAEDNIIKSYISENTNKNNF